MKAVNRVITLATLDILIALLVPLQSAQAGSEFVVIQGEDPIQIGDDDDAEEQEFFTFFLPTNIVETARLEDSAVLQYQVMDVDWDYNEIYVNPPRSTSCGRKDDDANQFFSIGEIGDYDADEDMDNDFFTEHRTFESYRLEQGENVIMVCARDEGGDLGRGQLDDFEIKHIVLHYKTSDSDPDPDPASGSSGNWPPVSSDSGSTSESSGNWPPLSIK